MLVLDNVSFYYKKDKYVLTNFSYKFADKGMYAITGESGRGKTTLLNLIAGVFKPKSGNIFYSEDVEIVNKNLVYIFQDNNLLDNLTVKENLTILLELVNKEYNKTKVEETLKELKIIQYLDVKIKNLSGGERQRVNIAVAILREAKIILADEPSSSLDEENVKIVFDIFKNLSEKILIIFTSHNKFLVSEYADYIIDLKTANSEIFAYSNNLKPARFSGNNLKFKSFFNINFKIIKTKIINLILNLLLIICLIICLGFVISLSLYDTDKSRKMFFKNNDFPIYLTDLDSNQNLEITSDIKIYNKSINYSNFVGGNSDFTINAPIVSRFVVDNSLDDYEIIVTDYMLYILREYGAINFNKPLDMIDKNIKILVDVNRTDNIYTYLNCVVKKVINTDFINRYNLAEFTNLNVNEPLESIMTSLICNLETFYSLTEYNEGVSFNSGDFLFLEYFGLEDNEIIITNQETKEALELKFDKEILVGTTLTFDIELNEDETLTKTLVVKDIYDTYVGSMPTIYTSEEVCAEVFHEQFLLNPGEVSGYYYTNDIVDDNVNYFIELLDSKFYNLSFYKQVQLDNALLSITNTKELFSAFLSGLLVIIFMLMLYLTYSSYTSNKNTYIILEMYGMKRYNELYFMVFSNLILLIIGSILSTFILYFINYKYDKLLSEENDISGLLGTFNIYTILIVFGIILLLTIIVNVLVFLLNIMRKNRTLVVKT